MKAKQTQNKFTIGTDPEFMVRTGGRIVSSIPFMQGNKHDKEEFGSGFAAYSDNVLIEGNVPPSDSTDNFLQTLGRFFGHVKEKHPELELSTQASHTFTEQECEHPYAKEFGCDPEFCAYAVDAVMPPEGGHTFRSAGGHIHLGNKSFNKKDKSGYLLEFDDKINAIKLMDIFVGISLVIMDNDPTSPARKKLYGKAGRMRPTPYGVEYRTPSPYWLSHPRIASIVSELTFQVMNIGENKQDADIISNFDSDKVRKAIDNHDKDLALEIFKDVPVSDKIREEILAVSQEVIEQRVYKNW